LTKEEYGTSVSPSEQRAFDYTFLPDAGLEPREYGLVISVFYSDTDGANFTNVVFNSTVGIVDSDQPMDFTTLFTYIGLVGVAGLVGFIVYNSTRSVSKKSRKVEYGTTGKATEIDNEWLEGTAAHARSPKGSRLPKSTTTTKAKSS